jgi:hypothetical protein
MGLSNLNLDFNEINNLDIFINPYVNEFSLKEVIFGTDILNISLNFDGL